jgi:acyl carrier protein
MDLPITDVPTPMQVDDLLRARRSELYEALVSAIRTVVHDEQFEVPPNVSLIELGLDSFAIARMVFELQRRYDIELDDLYAVPGDYTTEDYVVALATRIAAAGAAGA